MATAAQIEGNRRNAQRSTGPKTDGGKARARRNALKHGMAALTIMPSLPQEDPQQLEERTDRYTNDLQPRNAVEYDLAAQAARLALAIERAERIETALDLVRLPFSKMAWLVRIRAIHETGRAREGVAAHARKRRVQGAGAGCRQE